MLADPHAGIEAARDHVGHRIIRCDLHLHARMLGEEACDQRHQHEAAGGTRRVDAQRPPKGLAERAGRPDRFRDFCERGGDPYEERRTGLGRGDAAGGPVQEAHTHPGLQAAKGVAQGRGGHAEVCGGGAEAAPCGDGREGRQVGEIGTLH